MGLTKVANERYVPYLHFCGGVFCELSCIVGVKVAQSKGKITKIEAFLRIQTYNFLQNRYLGKKKILLNYSQK